MRKKNCFYFQKGGEVVEFAIISPIIILLFFGVIELSLGYVDKAILANASRVGARELVRNRDQDKAKVAATKTFNEDKKIFHWKPGSVIVFDYSPKPIPDAAGEEITVTLTYDYKLNFLSSFLPEKLTIKAQTKMKTLPKE